MTNQNLIHIKLVYQEAIESKMDILSLEKNSLTIAKIMKEYNKLRLKELETKTKLSIKINSLLKDIRKMQKILPTIEMPKEYLEKSKPLSKTKLNQDNDIELQLQEIQDKLNSLQQR